MNLPSVRAVCLSAVLLSLVAGVPLALADSEQDRARAAVQAGRVLPLKVVLERLARERPGQVLEVELEEEHGRWIYEIRLLEPGGRLVKLELDAATAQVLRSRQRSRTSDLPR
ncbi:MAG TPA: PepSY domain-containing protein [Burkholderiaceae bacterium]|nr:PepSY domain-containing protein [Burkholderiaceae bacterium]